MSTAAPTHVIAHLSDTHFLADQGRLYGLVDTDSTLARALSQLERSGIALDALVFTGDITDLGQRDAYQRVRALVDPVAQRLGAQVVWVMGNHDARSRMRVELLGEAATPVDEPRPVGTPVDEPRPVGTTMDELRPVETPATGQLRPVETPAAGQLRPMESAGGAAAAGEEAPLDRVVWLGGLRLVVLDTSVPGFHHGELTEAQRTWLRGVLATPAPEGSLLALHHPPIPTSLPLMPILELQDQELLAAVIRGTDVRGILGGHLHYTSSSLFAGVPISVAAATCYTMDLSAGARQLTGVDGGQSFNLVHVYEDQVVHSVVPVGDYPVVNSFPLELVDRIEAMTPEGQRNAFSRHARAGE